MLMNECIMFMYEVSFTIFVLMCSWFTAWLSISFNEIYSYDVLFVLFLCAL